MHTRGGARRHLSDVSLIDVRKTFRDTQDHGQDPTEQLLLAHYLQGCPLFLHRVPTMSSSIKHLQARWNSDAGDLWSRNLRYLGDRLHRTFDWYYVAYKLITLSCILFMFIEMIFIHFHSCVMFVIKSMSMCNDYELWWYHNIVITSL